MRERQLRGRLPDDGEQCTRLLELNRNTPRARTRAQRMCRANTERRQPVELLARRRRIRVEQKLQQTKRRMAEPDHHRVPNNVHRPGLVERSDGEATRRGEIDAGFEAVRTGKLEATVDVPLPEKADRRVGDGRGHADDLCGRIRLVECGGERFAGELESGPCRQVDGRAGRGAERAQNQRGVRCRQLGGERFRGGELGAGAVELECRLRAVDRHRDEQDRTRVRAARSAAHRLRRGGERLHRAVGNVGCGQLHPFELGGERPRRRDCDRLEPVVGGPHSDEPDLGSGHDPRRLGELVEGAGELRTGGCGGERAGERRQPFNGNGCGKALPIDLDDHAHRPPPEVWPLDFRRG